MRATSKGEAGRIGRLALLAALCAAAGAAPAAADRSPEEKRPAADARPPVRIKAKRGSARSVQEASGGARRDLVTFEGSVTVRRGEATLRCERAELTFVSARGGERAAERIEATGSVRLETPTRRAEGERLVYEAGHDRITLTGSERPAIRQGADVIRADSFVYCPGEDRFEAAGRVAAVLAPRPAEGAPAPGDEIALSREKETLVECSGGAAWDRPLGQGVFRKDVRVRQEGFDLACDALYVATEEREEGGAAEGARAEKVRVRRLTAAGNVVLTTRTRTATGDRAVYDPEARVFEIRGEPAARLREGDVVLEAPGIRYRAAEEAWESIGGPFRAVKQGRGEAR